MVPSGDTSSDNGAPTRSGRTILVVDDDGTARESLALLLRVDGYAVCTASTGEEALRVTAEVRPDVVLLDISMPGRSGLDICDELSRPAATAPSIIFVSGNGDDGIRARGLEQGAVDFVGKPFDFQELRARIQAALRTRSRMEALAARVGTDPLTGLFNRFALAERFAGLIDAGLRYGRDLSCLIIDIDHFKLVNDRHGHGAGDDVLREIASRLLSTCRRSDIVVRYGGEEFVVIAIETSQGQARALAERVRASIANVAISVRTPRGSTSIPITASVGVATLRPGTDADEILRRADEALYRAKRAGRDRVEVARLGAQSPRETRQANDDLRAHEDESPT